MQQITSLTNQKIKEYYDRIRSKQDHLIVIESEKIINELLKELKWKFEAILCTQSYWEKNQKKLQPFYDIIIIVNQAIINKLCYVKTAAEIIVLMQYHLSSFTLKKDMHVVVLDHLQDPSNMANIIRTCVAFNLCHIYVSRNSVDLLNEKIIRSSMGTLFKIKVNYYNNLKQLIFELKQNKICTIATVIDHKAICLDKLDTSKINGFAIIMGNEANGLSNNEIVECDKRIFINIKEINSLNVSSAFAIFAFYLTRGKLCKK